MSVPNESENLGKDDLLLTKEEKCKHQAGWCLKQELQMYEMCQDQWENTNPWRL